MAKDSLLVSPAKPLSTPSLNTTPKTIDNGEPGYQKRSKVKDGFDTINRITNSRLPQPTKK